MELKTQHCIQLPSLARALLWLYCLRYVMYQLQATKVKQINFRMICICYREEGTPPPPQFQKFWRFLGQTNNNLDNSAGLV